MWIGCVLSTRDKSCLFAYLKARMVDVFVLLWLSLFCWCWWMLLMMNWMLMLMMMMILILIELSFTFDFTFGACSISSEKRVHKSLWFAVLRTEPNYSTYKQHTNRTCYGWLTVHGNDARSRIIRCPPPFFDISARFLVFRSKLYFGLPLAYFTARSNWNFSASQMKMVTQWLYAVMWIKQTHRTNQAKHKSRTHTTNENSWLRVLWNLCASTEPQ